MREVMTVASAHGCCERSWLLRASVAPLHALREMGIQLTNRRRVEGRAASVSLGLQSN